MLLRSLCFLLLVLGASSPAWGCGCVGMPTGQLSEILEDYTLVYATPIKVEWLGHHQPAPFLDSNYRGYNSGKTTLIDAYIIGGPTQSEITFRHPSGGHSCGIQPTTGYRNWFLLKKESFGNYSTDYCTNKNLPYGAILDHYHNGNDPIVTRSIECSRKRQDKINLIAVCSFWNVDYRPIFKQLSQDYIRKKPEIINEQKMYAIP